MAGSDLVNSRQNAYLNRDRQLMPIPVPRGSIGPDPIKVTVPRGVARDIILENVGTVFISFTFTDPADHPIGQNLWKQLKPGAVYSSYCNFRDIWLQGEGGSYEMLLNSEGQINFGEVKVTDPAAQTQAIFRILASDDDLLTDPTSTPVTVISETVPLTKKWLLQSARVVCRAYGKFQIFLDGDLIGGGVTGPASENIHFDEWVSMLASAGKLLEVVYTQSFGPAVDLAGFVGYLEDNA